MTTTDKAEAKRLEFMAAMRGIPTNHVVQALNAAMTGIDWNGSSKGRMAEAYRDTFDSNRCGYTQMLTMNIDNVSKAAMARMAGVSDWRKILDGK